MSYAQENLVRIRSAWKATASEGSPLCVVLDTAESARDAIVDLYFRDGVLVGAKIYQTGDQAPKLVVGEVPS